MNEVKLSLLADRAGIRRRAMPVFFIVRNLIQENADCLCAASYRWIAEVYDLPESRVYRDVSHLIEKGWLIAKTKERRYKFIGLGRGYLSSVAEAEFEAQNEAGNLRKNQYELIEPEATFEAAKKATCSIPSVSFSGCSSVPLSGLKEVLRQESTAANSAAAPPPPPPPPPPPTTPAPTPATTRKKKARQPNPEYFREFQDHVNVVFRGLNNQNYPWAAWQINLIRERVRAYDAARIIVWYNVFASNPWWRKRGLSLKDFYDHMPEFMLDGQAREFETVSNLLAKGMPLPIPIPRATVRRQSDDETLNPPPRLPQYRHIDPSPEELPDAEYIADQRRLREAAK